MTAIVSSNGRWLGAVRCGGVLAALMPALWSVGCGPTSFLITPVAVRQPLQEELVLREGPWAINKLALIDVDGMLQNARPSSLLGPSGENPVSLLGEKLQRAADDPRVKAVILRINSPGGGVTATDLMYTQLREFRRRSGKPIVAIMMDVAASGGYYLACAADRIYAHPTTVTGSIGVVVIAPEVSGTMEKIGVQVNVIKSGELKDMGSLFRRMDDKERAVFQELINGMYARFLDVVVAGRPNLPHERVRELADGRVFLGSQAKELGLVDAVGTLDDAVAAAKETSGLTHAKVKVVRYVRPLDYRPNIYAQAPAAPAQVNLVNLQLPDWLSNPTPQLLYLWAPGW